MSGFKFKLDRKGVRELLKSSEMAAICVEYANATRARAGTNGYSVTTYYGKNRVNASVHAETWKAVNDCKKNNTLLKALGK